MKGFEDYSLRRIEEKDLSLLLTWRNSPRVHQMMLTDHVISYKEHYTWFQKNKENNPVRNLVFQYKGEPVGYIGYTEYDEKNKSCSPSIYLGSTENQPTNAGIMLCVMSIVYAFDVLNMKLLRTEVLCNNRASYKLSTLLGYKCVGTDAVQKANKTIDTFILEMRTDDRENNRWTSSVQMQKCEPFKLEEQLEVKS